jgi:hypothetical protein
MLTSLNKAKDETVNEIDILKFTSRCSLTMVLATTFGVSASEVHFDDEILKAIEE